MSLSSLFRCSVLLGLVACGAAPIDEPPARPQPSSTATGVMGQAPLGVTFTGPDFPEVGVPLVLEARVERRARIAAPVTLSLVLPAHVSLLEGAPTIELAPNTQADVHTLRFVVRVDAGDMNDTGEAKLALSAKGHGFGFHAEPVYRFGRTLPLVPMTRTGRELRVAGRNFGRSVDVTAR